MRGQDLLRSYDQTGRIRRRTASDHAGTTQASHPLVNLQRQIGNAQVSRLLAQREAMPEDELQTMRDPALQRVEEDEEIAPARDPALQRAAEDEEEIAPMRDPSLQRAADDEELQTMRLQRAAEDEEEIAPTRDSALQRSASGVTPEVGLAGGEISEDLTNRIQAQRGSGSTLDDVRRTQMESAFGTSFSDVRIHTGSEAHELNQGVGAKAFTVGSDIFFSNNASPTDDKLLGHELTHVVQQRGGGVSGPQASRSLNVTAANDASEAEADRMAAFVTSGAATAQASREADKE